jgi:hypothetical protein
MKKIIATLAVVFSLTTSATFASGGSSVNESVLKSFNKEFSGASNVSWVKLTDELYRFGFNYKGKDVEAFFAENGNLVATGTRIAEDHLPLLISKAVDAQYTGYSKTEVFEFSMDGETKYLLTLNKNNKNYVIKASGNGNLEVHKKEGE